MTGPICTGSDVNGDVQVHVGDGIFYTNRHAPENRYSGNCIGVYSHISMLTPPKQTSIENIMIKREIAHYEQFFPFFQNVFNLYSVTDLKFIDDFKMSV